MTYLPLTAQFRDYIEYAVQKGYDINVFDRATTRFSAPLVDALDAAEKSGLNVNVINVR